VVTWNAWKSSARSEENHRRRNHRRYAAVSGGGNEGDDELRAFWANPSHTDVEEVAAEVLVASACHGVAWSGGAMEVLWRSRCGFTGRRRSGRNGGAGRERMGLGFLARLRSEL
jgi:hypothetical protein